MAQPQQYNIYLSWDSNYYYEDDLGNIQTTNVATPITYMPENWDDIELTWERGWIYYAMLTSVSSQLKFVKDGAKILRYLFNTAGYDAKLEIYISKFNPVAYGYQSFFRADMDFMTYVDNDNHVLISAIDNDLAALIKSRDNTTYEIDIDGNPDIRFIRHDGIDLQCRLIWNGLTNNANPPNQGPEFYYSLTEGTNLTLTPIDQDTLTTGIVPRFVENNVAIINLTSIKLVFDIAFVLDGSVNHPSHVVIQLIEEEISTGNVISSTDVWTGPDENPGTSHTYTDTIEVTNYTFDVDRRLKLIYRVWKTVNNVWLVGPGTYSIVSHSEVLTVDFVNKYQTTYIPFLDIYDVAKQLLNKLATVNGVLVPAGLELTSDLLTTGNKIALFSGDACRSLKGSKIKLSFADLFKFINVKLGACFEIDKATQKAYIENKDRVFNNTAMSLFPEITEISNVSFTPLTQEVFNNLNIGNKEATYNNKGDGSEVTNGKDEFNTLNKYLTPSLKVNKTVDYVSPISCSMFEIERARANLDGRTIADADSDNEIFAIHYNDNIEGTYVDNNGNTGDYYLIFREPISIGTWEIENIFNINDAYNIMFSPARNIRANGKYFRSVFKFQETEYFKYQSSTKTNQGALKMVTKTSGVVDFDEGADILITSMCNDGEEYFYPILMNCETYDRLFVESYIENNKHGYISVYFLGNGYYAYINKISTKPGKLQKTKLSLLLTISNDVNNFVR